VNHYYHAFPGHKVTAKVYNMDLTEKFSKTASVDVGEDAAARVFEIPTIDGLSKTYLLRLKLQDASGKLVSSNFYWLSTQPDVSDWPKSNGVFTPIKTYADLTGLEQLPEVKVKMTSRAEQRGGEEVNHVTVENPTKQLAFAVHLTVLKGKDGEDIKPVLWEDNYFELMPGEKREVTATFDRKLLGGAKSQIKVDGWNVAAAQ